MATILIETDLDVVSKQRLLVEEALGPDSVYIRMKETLIYLIDNSELKGTDRAKVVGERVVGSNVNALINYNTTTTNYSLKCSKDSWVYYDTGVAVPIGHTVSIINNGTFSNTTYPNATTYGKVFFLSNGSSTLISRGYTYRNANGSEIFGDYYLYIYIEANVLKVKTYARNFTSQRMDVGTFSGSLTIHFFKY